MTEQTRLEGDATDVDDAAAMVERFVVAQDFDDAEAQEPTPETLDVYQLLGANWVRFEDESEGAWLASNHAIPAGDAR